MKRWRPRIAPSSILLSLLGATTILTAGWLAWQLLTLFSRPDALETLAPSHWLYGLLICALIALGIECFRISIRRWSLHYLVDRNNVTVVWQGGRYIIPLDALRSDGTPDLPIHHFGQGSPDEQVILHTTQAQYVLSMQQPAAFLDALEQRRALGVIQAQPEGVEYARPLWYAFQHDSVVRIALLAATTLAIISWGLLCVRYQLLPETVVLRFDPEGGSLGPRPRADLFQLPLMAVAIQPLHAVLALLLYRSTRNAAHVVLLNLALFELLLAGALMLLVTR